MRQRNDGFPDIRTINRTSRPAMVRDLCALAVVAAFGITCLVWAAELAPHRDAATLIIVSDEGASR